MQATGRDFTIARLLYEDTGAGGRRALGWMGTDISHPDINAHYFSSDNRWVMDGQVMHSDVDGVTESGIFGDFSFRPQRGEQHTVRATYIGDTLDINDLGFLTRNDQMNLDYTYFRNESDIAGLRERSGNIFEYSIRYFPQRIDDRLGRGSGDFRVPGRWGVNLGYSTDRAKSLSYNLGLRLDQDELGPARNQGSAGIVWRPDHRFSADLSLDYTDREALLVHQGSGSYTSFGSHQWSPRLEMNYFITAKQQLGFSVQWTALKAFEDRFWQVNPA